ncbi:MAG: helix-turn-helix domain-containing protein [Planctomycetota bacterium]
MELADKVQRLRGGRSNAELGKAAGCSATTIHNIARAGRQPSFAVGVRLARALGVAADWLGDDAQDWPPPPSMEDKTAAIVRQALESRGMIGELSDDERALLSAWRQLGAEGRAELRGYLRGLQAKTQGGSEASLSQEDKDLLRRVKGILAESPQQQDGQSGRGVG